MTLFSDTIQKHWVVLKLPRSGFDIITKLDNTLQYDMNVASDQSSESSQRKYELCLQAPHDK